jgi:O-antigen ligase
MDVAAATRGWQRSLLAVTFVASAWALWPTGTDHYALPQATVVVVAAVVSLWLAAVRWAWVRRVEVPRSPVLAAAAVFVAGFGLATLASTSRLQSLVGQHTQYAGFATYASAAVLLATAVRVVTIDTVDRLLHAVVVATALVAGYGMVQWAGTDPVSWDTAGQVVSTLGNPNFAGGWLSLAIGPCLVVAALPTSAFWWRFTAGAAAAGAVFVISVTGSFQGVVAGGTAALAALAGILAVRGPRQRWWNGRAVARGALGLGLLAAVLLAVGWSAVERQLDGGLYDRKAFWSAAWDVFGDHPVTGTGPDSFQNQFTERRPYGHAGNNAGAVHDVPLDMLANGGLVAGLPYLAVLAATAASLVAALRRIGGDQRLLVVGVGTGWVGYVVQSLVSIDKPSLVAAHWILAGAAGALALRREPIMIGLPGRAAGPGRWGWVAGATVVSLALLVPITRPIRAETAIGRALDELRAGDVGAAVDRAERARQLAPWEPSHTFYAANVHYRAGDGARAVREVARGAALAPGDPTYALSAAQLAALVGDRASAARFAGEAIVRDPNFGGNVSQVAQLLDQASISLDEVLAATTGPAERLLVEGILTPDPAIKRRAFESLLRRDPANRVAKDQLRHLP